MKKITYLAAGIICAGAGIALLISGILFASAFDIIWGIVCIGAGIFNIVLFKKEKAKEVANGSNAGRS